MLPPYHTTTTDSGVKVETHLGRCGHRDFVKLSGPAFVREVLESCNYSQLYVGNTSHGISVNPEQFKTFSGLLLWDELGSEFSSPVFTARDEYARKLRAWFEVQPAPGGGVFLTAYAEAIRKDGPTVTVQLDVEFD